VQYRGDRKVRPWKAEISLFGKNRYIGYYATEEEAGRAYDQTARRYRPGFTLLNFPDEVEYDADTPLLKGLQPLNNDDKAAQGRGGDGDEDASAASSPASPHEIAAATTPFVRSNDPPQPKPGGRKRSRGNDGKSWW